MLGRWTTRTRTRRSRLLVLLFAVAVGVSFGATQSMYMSSAATAPSGPGASSIGGRIGVDRTCPLASLNPLVFDVSETPDALDPAVTFTFGGWAAVPQVYQTLVQYNGSSSTGITGLLAASWTISPDRINYTFHLRTGVHFSNGDPFNAYGMWFSLNRALVMNQSPAFILQQNFWFPGLDYYSSPSASASASAWMAHVLNTYNFVAPSAAELAVMTAVNQSFQVVDAQTITLRVGAGYLGAGPYTYLLATLADPIASAVDPVVVQANGGVSADSINPWMLLHMIGTGPYVLSSFDFPTGYSLAPDPNYWGTGAARDEPWNVALQPARSSVQIQFETNVPVQVSDLKLGAVAGIPSDLLDVPTLNQLRADPCVVTKIMDPVYGSAFGGWWVYMNQNVPPFNNLSVRRAVAHAIDVGRIINLAFGGYAQPWVGPVPPNY